MTRRNASQMDLLAYRAPKPKARRKPRQTYRVAVKFGAADGVLGYGRSMPILARLHRHHDWLPVGWVDVEAYDLNEHIMGDTEDFRVEYYDATLSLDAPDDAVLDLDDYEHSVELVRSAGRFSPPRPVRTAAEGKRLVKAWVTETLETVGWGM